MMIEHQIVTAELRNWRRVDNIIVGKIYGDKKQRFSDGSTVYSSDIVNVISGRDFYLFQTLNSVYKCMPERSAVLGTLEKTQLIHADWVRRFRVKLTIKDTFGVSYGRDIARKGWRRWMSTVRGRP
jgi:hypothetical protein